MEKILEEASKLLLSQRARTLRCIIDGEVWELNIRVTSGKYRKFSATSPSGAVFKSIHALRSHVQERSDNRPKKRRRETLNSQEQTIATDHSTGQRYTTKATQSATIITAALRLMGLAQQKNTHVRSIEGKIVTRRGLYEHDCAELKRQYLEDEENLSQKLQSVLSEYDHRISEQQRNIHSLAKSCVADTCLDCMQGHIDVSQLVAPPLRLTHEYVMEEARKAMSETKGTKIMRAAALAVLNIDCLPLLVAECPVKQGHLLHASTQLHYEGSKVICAEHDALLCDVFSVTWRDYMAAVVRSRTAIVYDITEECDNRSVYVGSVIVSKFIADMKGARVPILHIDSIVLLAQLRRKNYGSKVKRFLRDLLFSDCGPDGGNVGYIFAQCVKNAAGFWDWMDIGNVGRTLTFQMCLMYTDYAYETNCSIRHVRLERDET